MTGSGRRISWALAPSEVGCAWGRLEGVLLRVPAVFPSGGSGGVEQPVNQMIQPHIRNTAPMCFIFELYSRRLWVGRFDPRRGSV